MCSFRIFLSPVFYLFLFPTLAGAQTATSQEADFEILDAHEGTFEVEHNTLVNGALETVTRSYTTDYFTLGVPEKHGSTDGRRIEIPVIRIRATGLSSAEPVFWFEGGPGQSNMSTFDYDYLVERHDHVMVGYRGVDGSVSLNCPEIDTILRKGGDVLADQTLEEIGDAFMACWERLRTTGIDIDQYTTVDVIKDMELARRALGYDRINIVSESFGTRLAYLYGVMYPAAIHRSVMLGANPPGAMVWEPELMDKTLMKYSDLWARDPAASKRTPDLARVFKALNVRMADKWLFMPIYPGNVRVSAFAMLFERSSAAMAIDAYVAAYNGDPSGLWLISFVAPYIFPEIVNWGDSSSKAISSDGDPSRDYDRELMPVDALIGAPLGRFLWRPLDKWPIRSIPEELRNVQPSDVETLIISSNLDFSTPAENTTRNLLPNLPNGKQVILSDMGHIGDLWRLQPEGTHRLVTSFIETGVADASLVRHVPMEFEVSWGYPVLAKILVAIVLVVFVLLSIALWWGVRRFA